MSSEEIKFTDLRVITTTDSAFLLARPGDTDDQAQWFPRYYKKTGDPILDYEFPDHGGEPKRGDVVTFWIPDWLVDAKGW